MKQLSQGLLELYSIRLLMKHLIKAKKFGSTTEYIDLVKKILRKKKRLLKKK